MSDKQELQQKQEVQTAEGVERMPERKAFVPRVDIYETDEAMDLVADMPGVDEKNVEIMLEKDVLTVHGHVEPRKEEGAELAYAEYEDGDFERSFVLSEGIDRENIEASVKHGVLHIRLPKAKEAKSRTIAVRAS